MKKSLIALAVLGAFSGVAMASGSNVQLYGLIDEGITHYTGLAPAGGGSSGQTVSSTGLSSGVQSGDRIGLKGTEDLGGGVSAIFDVETGFCGSGLSQDKQTVGAGAAPQTYCTGGGFMQRQAWAGLTGNFGTVTGGRQYTAPFDNEVTVDPFGFGLNGDIGNIGLVHQYGMYRADQTLAYVTPNLSGFTGVVAYVFAAGPGTVPSVSGAGSNVPRAWTLNGQYGNGPITVGVNYTRTTNLYTNPAITTPTTTTYSLNSATGAITGTTTPNVAADGALKLWQIYGAYDFGVAKISGIYEHATQDYYSGNAKFWMLGATIPVGPGAILASFSENKDTLVLNGKTGDGMGTAKQYAIGYTYNLSKQTDLYASYAHISNDSASSTQTGTALAVGSSTDAFSGVTGQSSSGFAVGIRHMF